VPQTLERLETEEGMQTKAMPSLCQLFIAYSPAALLITFSPNTHHHATSIPQLLTEY
jgi:hypothetical protein